jgi:formylglycine-generating enzyme required for sulfatase activity
MFRNLSRFPQHSYLGNVDTSVRWFVLPLIMTFLLTLTLFVSNSRADTFKPEPGNEDIVLPMPGDTSMVFRPVYIGENDEPYAMRKFTVGDPSGGFKESPTTVVLGGAFVGEDNGRKDWLYYIGKYEVTEAQYAAVMGLSNGETEDTLKSQYPVHNISLFDAMEFIDRYNQWLFANGLDKLPKNKSAVGYVRLPSEIEWEFAARGGSKVSDDDFDRKKPYKGNLADFEWFSGPKSSHNKIKKVGKLKPNILGIHDILANVAEMTFSLYQIEYYQGRMGGFVTRGGHYLTSEKRIRSSLRTEEPFYTGSSKNGFKPNRKPTMGFRLVISSIIYADRNTAKHLKTAWGEYRSGKGADMPAAVSVSPTSVQTDVKNVDAFKHLKRLKVELRKMGSIPEGILQEMGFLEASMGDIKFILRQADEDSAFAWAKIAAERGFFIFREFRKLPTLNKALKIAERSERTKMAEKLKLRKAELEQNIEKALTSYSDSFRQLATIAPDAIEKGFEKYINFLLEHNAPDQLRVLKTVQKHFDAYRKDKRADKDNWKQDFMNIEK